MCPRPITQQQWHSNKLRWHSKLSHSNRPWRWHNSKQLPSRWQQHRWQLHNKHRCNKRRCNRRVAWPGSMGFLQNTQWCIGIWTSYIASIKNMYHLASRIDVFQGSYGPWLFMLAALCIESFRTSVFHDFQAFSETQRSLDPGHGWSRWSR